MTSAWSMLYRRFLTGLTIVAMAVALSACASAESPKDPFEPVNRVFFRFNTIVDEGIAQPLARAYRFVVPELARNGVTNFFNNLGDIYSMANNLLQLKPTNAGQDLLRVAVNTAFGFGGLLDIAGSVGIERQAQDFGLTLARWGVPSGPYLVLPLFGPRTLRDVSDDFVLMYQAPVIYIIRDWRTRLVLSYVSLLDLRAGLLDTEEALEGVIIDDYRQIRDAYLQRREYLVSGGRIDYDDDYLDEEDDGLKPDVGTQESKGSEDEAAPSSAKEGADDGAAAGGETKPPAAPVSDRNTESEGDAAEKPADGPVQPAYPVSDVFVR